MSETGCTAALCARHQAIIYVDVDKNVAADNWRPAEERELQRFYRVVIVVIMTADFKFRAHISSRGLRSIDNWQ